VEDVAVGAVFVAVVAAASAAVGVVFAVVVVARVAADYFVDAAAGYSVVGYAVAAVDGLPVGGYYHPGYSC